MKIKTRFLNLTLALCLIASAFALSPASPVEAADESQGVSPQGFLNPDGTLNLSKDLRGSLDLSGWDVSLDPARGPLFAPLGAPAEGDWENLGGGALPVSPNNFVSAVAVSGSDVYIGGSFTDLNDDPTMDYIAKWDGTNWSALGSNGAGDGSINNSVNAIAVSGTDLYVGGDFEDVNNGGTALNAADYIAKWDGANWSALGSNGAGDGSLSPYSEVNAIAVSGSDVYVGGFFESVNNRGTVLNEADNIAKWDGTDWSALGSNGAGDGSLNDNVYAIAVSGSDVYAGGRFADVNNSGTELGAADYIAKWDGANWSALGSNGSGDGSLNNSVYAIAVSGTDIYAGGWFENVNNSGTELGAADYIAKWDGTNWSALGSDGAGGGSLPPASGVKAIVISGANVYVGGWFENVNNGGTPLNAADYIAKWDGTNWSALGSDGAGGGSLNSEVYVIAVGPGALYAGGDFANVNNNGAVLPYADRVAAYGLDVSAPTVVSITRADVNPTSAASVDFNATFSEAVTGVDAGDFSLTTTGGISGATVTNVSGSGDTYTVAVDTGAGNGSIRLDIPASAAIQDPAGNALDGLPYISGEAYDILKLCYVDVDASSGANDGLSWSDAYTDLQNALADTCTEIWVAAGTYYPTSGGDRAISFNLKSGVKIYGGFAGTENALSQRNISANPTILSGDIGTQDDNSDNSYHVVYANGVDNTAILDGFTVTGGNANGGTSPHYMGGGMYNENNSSPTLTNVTFNGNSATNNGGGIYNGDTLTVTNSTLSNNSADFQGGGIFNSGTVTVTNSTLSGNYAGNDGGGIYNGSGTVTVTNSALSGNSAANGGGISTYYSSTLTVTNSTLSGNSATSLGGGIHNEMGTVTITNSTLSGNSAANGGGISNMGTLNYSNTIIANSASGGDCYNIDTIGTNVNNLVEDGTCSASLRGDPNLGPLQNNGGPTQTHALLAGSLAIDAADDTVCAVVPVNNLDQRGVTRPQGAHCDIGSYETPSTFGAISKWTSSFDTSHGWTVKDYVRTVGDVDGDGKDDLVGFGLDGVYVALSNGSSFDSVSKWSSSFDLSHGWTVSQYVRTVGDVNGDGKADAVGFGLDGVYVALSNGTGFDPVSKWTSAFDLSHGWTVKDYVRTVGDVNGDGKDDLVGFGQDGVYVALANASGDGFDPVSKWTSAFDLSHGWTVSQYVRTVGDVDGDGKDDLVGFGQDGVYVALSNGAGFDPVSKWTSAFDTSHGWTVKDYVRTVGDVDGDNKVDLVGFGLDGVYVALSNGSSFVSVSKWTSAFDLSHGWTVSQYARTVGDVNGGGKADLVGFGLDGVYVTLSK